MDLVGRDVVEGVTGRGVAQIGDLVAAVERIDQRRQAGGFAGKAGEHDAAPALVHQRGERLARVARPSIQRTNGVARLKKADSLSMRMNATGKPIWRE